MKRVRRKTDDPGAPTLRKIREQKGLQQSDVARFLGISQAAVSGMESSVARLSMHRIVELARIYGLSLEWFVTGAHFPRTDVAGIAIELEHYGLWDVDVSKKQPPGAFRRVEEVVTLALCDAPSPRIVNGLPALLLRTPWSPLLLAAFADVYQVGRRVAWLTDLTCAIHAKGLTIPNAPIALPLRCQQITTHFKNVDVSIPDSLGTPTENPKTLSRAHRRWGITYDQTIEDFCKRAALLLRQRR